MAVVWPIRLLLAISKFSYRYYNFKEEAKCGLSKVDIQQKRSLLLQLMVEMRHMEPKDFLVERVDDLCLALAQVLQEALLAEL